MRTKKLLSFLCLLFCLLAGCAVTAGLVSESQITAEAAETTGFHKDSTGMYYITGSGYRARGPVNVTTNGKTYRYFFDEETGYLLTGKIRSVLYEGNRYLVSSSGTVYTTPGLKCLASTGKIYCVISSSGKLAVNRAVTLNGNTYVFGKTGQMYTSGLKTVGGRTYLVKSTRVTVNQKSYKMGIAQTGWQTYRGKTYYFSAKGIMKTGKLKIDNSSYYINSDGSAATGNVKLNGKYYYADSTGKLVSGWVQRSDRKNRWYYYSKRTNAMLFSKFISYNGNYYYVSKNGYMRVGWYTVNGKTYYGNKSGSTPDDGYGARLTGWQNIGARRYYFSKRGVRQSGKWIVDNGNRYYLKEKKGYVLTGFVSMNTDADGKTWSSAYTYYFDSAKDGAMATGWQTIDGKSYYFRPETTDYGPIGSMLVSTTVKISGVTYTVDSNGIVTKKEEPATYSYTAYSGSATLNNWSSVSGSWSITVNRQRNIVTVYKGNTVVRAMWCTTGTNNATPTGTTTIRTKYKNWELMGPSYGFYCMHLWDDILFHSIPYNTSGNHYSMSAGAFNKLGTQASHGCIRLAFADTKWIFNNVPTGTTVTVSDYCATPVTPRAITTIPSTQTWDPTDDER